MKFTIAIIAAAILCYAIEWWLKTSYKISFVDIVLRFYKSEVSWGLKGITGFFFLLTAPLAWMLLISLLSWPINAVFAEKTEMVYGGNPEAGFAKHYALPTPTIERSQISVDGIESVNLTFKPLFKKLTFMGVNPNSGNYGLPIPEVSIYGLLALIAWLIFLATCISGCLHVNAHEASMALAKAAFPTGMDVEPAFEVALSSIGLNKAIFGSAGIFGSIIMAMVFMLLTPKSQLGEPILDITLVVEPEQKLHAIPVSINDYYERVRRSRDSDIYDTRDTGVRAITFELVDLFQVPVYISLKIDGFAEPELEKMYRESIKQKLQLELLVTEELGVKLAGSP